MKHPLWSTLLLIAVCVLAQTAFAQSAYRLVRIAGDDSATPAFDITASDLNDRGEVVGFLDNAVVLRPFLWRNGVLTDFGDAPGSIGASTEAAAINDRGEVAGATSTADGGARPILFSNGRISELKAFSNLNLTAAFPRGINNRRQIIGDAFIVAPGGAEFINFEFLQTGSRVIQLGDSHTSNAANINELGVVAGHIGDRAVIWIGERVIDLGVLPGAVNSTGRDINDFNEVVGSIDGPARAFLWRRGRMTELPGLDLAGTNSIFPIGINNQRQIIGVQASDSGETPLLWERDGRAFDLNQLISNDDPLKPFVTLSENLRINNRGQILAYGRDSRSLNLFRQPYLLTPIPKR